MKSEKDFLHTSLRIGFISALNSVTIGLGGIWISREIGPESRGVLTKMVLIFVALGIMTEFGVLSAATYFASVNSHLSKNILKEVRFSMLRNTPIILIPTMVFLAYFKVLNFNQILIISSAIVVSNLVVGPAHILQSLNIELWRKVQSTQAVTYVICFAFLFHFDMTSNLAFLIFSIPGILASLVARIVLFKMNLSAKRNLNGDNYFNKINFNKYSQSSFMWIILTESFNRIDLILAAFVLSNSELGNFSLVLSWLMISTPFISAIGNIVFPDVARDNISNLFSTRKLCIYLRNTALTSIIIIGILILAMPYTLDRFMTNVYFGYSRYIYLMAFLVLFKQVNSVLGEIIRGLNLNLLYSWTLGVSLIGIILVFKFMNLETQNQIILLILIGQIINFIASLCIILRHLKRNESV